MSRPRSLHEVDNAVMCGQPRQRFVIPDVLPAGPCFLYGKSGSGKTGIAIRTALSVAAGLPWAGRAPAQGAVIYIAGEDYLGVEERLAAGARALGLQAADVPLFLLEPAAEGLVHRSFAAEVEVAANEIRTNTGCAIRLIVVDTLGACFGNESQDDARSGTLATGTLERLARGLSCGVLVLHHPGKRADSGMRGSQVLRDRADAVIKAWRAGGGDTFLEVEKMRNERGGARFSFSIEAEELVTRHGSFSVQVVKKVVITEGQAESLEEAQQRRKQSMTDQAFGILCRLASGGQMDVKAWQDECYTAWEGKSPGAKRKAFSAAQKKLQGERRINVSNGVVSVTVTRDDGNSSPVTPEPDTVTVTPPVTP